MEILEKLFGSNAKVKIIKLFLFNSGSAFDSSMVAERAKVSMGAARKEIYNLERIGFIKPKSCAKDVKIQKNRGIKTLRKKTNGWTLNPKFRYMDSVKSFLGNLNTWSNKDLVERLSVAGKIQLLIISGVFIKDPDSRVDMLIVGNSIKEGRLDNIIKTIESEIGQEVRYAVFETSQFNYRLSIFDKLIRDILDYPHEKIINKLNL
jgi:hypothetical protein